MKKILWTATVLLFFLLGSATGGMCTDPVEIFYDVTPIAGVTNGWTYSYRVVNNSLDDGYFDHGLHWFRTYFPDLTDTEAVVTEYSNIGNKGYFAGYGIEAAHSLWGPGSIYTLGPQQVGGIWYGGFYGAMTIALNGNIPTGTEATGFDVSFIYTGPGTPGPQYFDVLDPSGYDPNTNYYPKVFDGWTQLDSVPEPLSALMLAFGLFCLAVARGKR